MIKFHKNGICTDLKKLNKDEINAFILFLKSEQERHLRDVEEIYKKIKKLKKLRI